MDYWSVGVLRQSGIARRVRGVGLSGRIPFERLTDEVGKVLPFVPEGPNEGSQAIYCLEQVQSRVRPVGHGLSLTHGSFVVQIVTYLSDQSYRSLRDGSLFARISGNELPGYLHSVPPGQTPRLRELRCATSPF